MQALIQCLQRQRPPSLGLCASCSASSTPAVGVHDGRQTSLGACACLVVSCVNVVGREGCADAERYQDTVDAVCEVANRSLEGLREEMGKGESVRSIALDDRVMAGCSGGQRWADAVEAQVDPGGHEAKVGQEHGSLGAEDDGGDGVGEQEDGGEVLDTHADETFGDGDGVFGDELLEGDEEAGLDGDAAGDGGAAGRSQWGSGHGSESTYSGTVLEVMT